MGGISQYRSGRDRADGNPRQRFRHTAEDTTKDVTVKTTHLYCQKPIFTTAFLPPENHLYYEKAPWFVSLRFRHTAEDKT